MNRSRLAVAPALAANLERAKRVAIELSEFIGVNYGTFTRETRLTGEKIGTRILL